ncbi:MAG: pentapeptide repeat-containing protein, partial [Deltaproteobacteria bacterium]
EGANLKEANLQGANLQFSYFGRADLEGVNLQGANLEYATFWKASLRGADLRDVKNLTQEQLDQACGDEKTKLPEGLTIKKCPQKSAVPERHEEPKSKSKKGGTES